MHAPNGDPDRPLTLAHAWGKRHNPSMSQDVVRDFFRELDKAIRTPPRLEAHGTRLLTTARAHLSRLGAVEWRPVGSACCETSVAEFSDVDMVAVFGDPIRHGRAEAVLPYSLESVMDALAEGRQLPAPITPAAAFDLFARCLEDMGPVAGFGGPRRAFPAVHFASLTDEPSVELVPGCEADFLWDSPLTAPSSGLVDVAFPATPDEWRGTSAVLHRSTLDLSPGGADYTCREVIRILKLIKYRRSIPVLSYFLELFTLRWLEGSHTVAAESVDDIVRQVDTGWTRRAPDGLLVDDIAELLGALADQLKAAHVRETPLTTADLTTPETSGTVRICEDLPRLASAAEGFALVAARARTARDAVAQGDHETALSVWRRLLGEDGDES